MRTLNKSLAHIIREDFSAADLIGRRAGSVQTFDYSKALQLGKGVTVEEVAAILADSPATIRRHYAKWTPEFQARQDRVIRLVHGTNLAQAEEQASKC